MPVTAQGISEIATLGGQLGISAEHIDAFTESTAKFAATTDVSAQSAAEGLGRLAQLSGIGQSNFDELTASIYQVGVTSVATESAVLAVATQISVSARQAGFAADQTIALAGALASLGVAPERARGSIQRIFNVITNAADNGGEELEKFARLTGQTADEFAATWKGDPQTAFQDFLAGLGEADKAGKNMNNILADMGISAVRDTDALKRLAQNTEVYANSIAQANEGWNDGTVFAEGYATQTDTLNAKLQVLTQTIKAMIEGAGNNAALKQVVDLLQAFADVAQNLAHNPFGKFLMGVAIGLSLLVGGLAAIATGVALATASMFAMITVLRQLTKDETMHAGAIGLAKFALIEYATAMGRASAADMQKLATTGGLITSMKVLGATTRATSIALKGLAVSTGIGIAFVALGLAFEKWNEQAERTKQIKADLDQAFGEAITLDVKAFQEAGGVLKEIPTDLSRSADASAQAQGDAEGLADSFVGLAEDADTAGTGVESVTGKVYDLSEALGEATDKAVRKSISDLILGEGTGEEQLLRAQRLQTAIQELGYTWDQVVLAVQTNDVEFLSQLDADALGLYNEYINAGVGTLSAYEREVGEAANELHVFTGSLGIAATSLYDSTQAAQATSVVFGELGLDAEEAGSEIGATAEEVRDLSDGLFDSTNALMSMTNSMYDLASSVYDTGGGFDVLTQDGATNMAAFQDAVSSAAAIAGNDANLFISLIDNIIAQMVASGVTGVEQLMAVRNQYALITGGIPTANSDLTASSILAGQFADGMGRAAKETQNVGNAAKQAKEEIRTLKDYVSDLGSVIKDAFDFRFGLQQAVDDVTSAINDISESFEDAKDRVRELNIEIKQIKATLRSLKSDKAILEYQLQVALEYGDTLRANEIAAELQQNAADTAEANKDLVDTTKEKGEAEEEATATATGNSEAAMAQRAAILNLVQGVEDSIIAYAAAGHTQAETEAYAKKLKAQLAAQLKAWGYNNEEIATYTASLNDVITIIDKVPRDLTIETNANTNPAQAALNEFFAKNKDKKITTTHNVNTNYKQTGHVPTAQERWAIGLTALVESLAIRLSRATNANNPNLIAAISTEIKRLGDLKYPAQYYKGGYTGHGGKYEYAGDVHKGEYVIESERVNQLGVPFLNALGRSTERGFSGGGPVNVTASIPGAMMVELSPTDRRLLANAGMNNVYLDGKKVTGVVNGVNAASSARGIQ
jgi:TP901 family phage tail tape measure protein